MSRKSPGAFHSGAGSGAQLVERIDRRPADRTAGSGRPSATYATGRMPELVALDLAGGAAFVDALARGLGRRATPSPCSTAGCPPRPRPELLEALRPGRRGRRRRASGGPRRRACPSRPGDALVVATSGTTGDPQGGGAHPRRGRGLGPGHLGGGSGVDPARHRWLCCLPLAHIGGLSVVTRAVLTGTPVTVLDRASTPTVVERLGRRRRGHPRLAGRRPPSRRVDPGVFDGILLGGAAPPESAARQRRHHLRHDRDRLGRRLRRPAPRRGRAGHRRPGADGGACPARSCCARRCCCAPTATAPIRRVAGPDGAGGWLPTGDAGQLAADGRLWSSTAGWPR